MTQEETAQRVGKSRSAVANAMRLLKLCPPCGPWWRTGGSPADTPELSPPLPAMQESAANAIIKDELSVRQTEQLVKKLTAPPSRSTGTGWALRRLCQGGRQELGSRLVGPPHCHGLESTASNWNTTGWRI
ncbi:MAG: ParB/RepB/Spo0J family partition protein [Oscillospiraceae bacterium]